MNNFGLWLGMENAWDFEMQWAWTWKYLEL